MAIDRDTGLERLPNLLRTDGAPVSAHLLRTLARGVNNLKSRVLPPTLINDGWVSPIRITGTAEQDIAYYAAVPFVRGYVEVRWRVRRRIASGDAGTGTVRLYVLPHLYTGSVAGALQSTAASFTTTTFAVSAIQSIKGQQLADIAAGILDATGAWNRRVWLVLRAQGSGAGTQVEVSHFALWTYGLDSVAP